MKKNKEKINFQKIKEIMFKQMPDKNSNIMIYIWAALIPVAIMLLTTIWLKISPFGSGSYLIIDMVGQYSAFLAYLRTIILGTGNNIFYSFSKTIGGDVYGLFTYYLASPINLIVTLFPSKDIPYAVLLIIFTKIGLAGLTSNILITRGKTNDWKSLIFSTSYALTAYNISFGYNIMWMDAIFLLPLIIMGIDKILENKSPIQYVICLVLTLMINYYIGFMVCIFSGMYFIYKLLIKKDKLKKYIIKTLKFLIISLIAVGIAAVVLLPSFKLIQEGRATFDTKELKFEANYKFIDILSRFYTHTSGIKQVDNGGMPHIFCGVAINLFLITYFLNKKIDTREKILSSIILGILLISFHVNTINLIWHGLNGPAWFYYRYSFVFSFMCIMLAHRSFEKLKEGISLKEIIKTLLIYIAITIFVENKKYEYIRFQWLYFDFALFLVYIYLIYNYINYKYIETEKNKKIVLTLKKHIQDIIIITIIILNSANLLINAKYSLEDIQGGIYSTQFYQQFQEETQKIIDKIQSEDTGFYRLEKTFNRSLNDGMQLNYNGIAHSSSTYQLSTSTFLGKLGIQKKQWFLEYNNGSTRAVDNLLGVKYVLAENDINKDYTELFSEGSVTVYRNENVLPLAFTVEDDVKNINMDTENTFEIQNQIYKKITGKDKNIFSKETNYEIETENLSITEYESDTIYKKQNEDIESSIKYKIKVNDTKNLYAYITAYEGDCAEIYINGEKKVDAFYSYDTEMINLGKYKVGETIELKIVLERTMATIRDMQLYYEDTKILEEYCNILKQEKVEIDKISSSRLRETVKVNEENKYILFTIPYSNGWKIKVDGKEVEKYEVMNALIAIKIEQGEHIIEMSYIPTGFRNGAIISIISLITMSLILIIDKKTAIKVENKNKM